MNLTNMMIRWKTAKDRPCKGGFHAMTHRLDQFKGVDWDGKNAFKLLVFCKDFQINHELVPSIDSDWWQGVVDATKCSKLLMDIAKY